MGMDQDMDINQLVVVKVESVAPDGSFSMKNKIHRIWGKMTNPMMGDIEFDTDKPAEKAEEGDQMAQVKAMLQQQLTQAAGTTVTMEMSPDGTAKSASGGVDQAADQMVQQMTGLGKLPTNPVGVGDTWEAETNQAGMQGMKMKVKLKNTLKAFDADTVTIEQTGAMDMAMDDAMDENNPAAAMLKSMKTKNSTLKNTLKISRKDGLTLAADMEMHVEMSMGGDDAGGGGMPGGMEMVMKMKMHQERKAAPAVDTPEKATTDAAPTPAKEDAPPPVVPPAPEEKK
jgi:hypothetical protein